MRAGPLATAAALVAAMLASALPGREAQAQSVADCMEASPARALSLCRALIDEGRDNADVWTQLALGLDKSGRRADARAAIDEALLRYPRDVDLLALRDRLDARSSEEEQLERAARRNTTAVAQGELKLLCRIREGVAAIEACRRYLAMTDVDGERIRARLAELERALPSVARAPASDTATRPSSEPARVPPTEPVAESSPEVVPEPPPAVPRPEPVDEPETPSGTGAETSLARVELPPSVPDPDVAQRRERVASIQRALDALGLPVGAADGIAGRRTREALARFDTLTGGSESTLDETTLAALEAERPRLEAARTTLAASRAAARSERFDEAIDLLARAESESALLRVPPDYRAELERESRRVLERARLSEAESRRRAEAERRAESEATATLPRTEVAELPVRDDASSGLLVRIGALERRLAEADEAARRERARLREQVQRTLARPPDP